MMDCVTFLCFVGFVHCVIYFFNTIFKSCCLYPYLTFLKQTGLEVKFMMLQWITSSLNRRLQKWGLWRPRFLHAWFSVGAFLTVALVPFAVILLVHSTLSQIIQKTSSDNQEPPIMETVVVIPGYNLPLDDIVYYILALFISTVVHEFGHAIAAVREDVHIHGTGLSLLFILPAAAVYLDTKQLNALAPSRKLRVLCAGVWHNIVLVIYTLLFIYSMPLFLQPFFLIGKGVYVTDIAPGSGVLGPTGLRRGNTVTALNECSVHNTQSWKFCLVEALRNQTPGYCIPAEFVRKNDESVQEYYLNEGGIECCSAETAAKSRLCFQLVDDSGGPVELPELACLHAREVVEMADGLCSSKAEAKCKPNLHCLRPTVGNITKLLTIHLHGEKVVLFYGNPAEIYKTVKVSDFIPKTNAYDATVPQYVETLMKYLFTLSSGLALANVLPVFFFDGQYISSAICDLFLSKYVKDTAVRQAVSLCANVLGTLLLFSFILTPFLLQYVK